MTGLAPLPIVANVRHATTRAVYLVALALIAAAGCSEKKRTEVVVGLATDLNAPAPLSLVHLLASVQDFPLDNGEDRIISGDPLKPYTIPGTFGVYSSAGTADRVSVTMTAYDDTSKIIVLRSAVFNLVPEKTLFVRLGLVSACLGKLDCPRDLTCIDGRCQSPFIDTSTLPEYHAGDENDLSCASTVSYVNTGTRQPLAVNGAPCASGVCSEGVCLTGTPSGLGGAGAGPGAGGQGGGAGHGGSSGAGGQGGAGGDSGVIPQLTSLEPDTGTAGTSVTLQVRGEDISANWSIVFDGNRVPTTIGTDAQGTYAFTSLNILTNISTGQVPVWLAKGSLTTNTLYFTVTPAAGAPAILDYTPDNAMPGATISIVGTNLLSEAVIIADPVGRPMSVVGMGTTTWVGASVDRVDVTVPSDMVTGALTAMNSKGSFRGRVFNVGQNLSLLDGVVATSSTEYNTTTWSRMSGYDNSLQTSFFTAHGDCIGMTTCTTAPFYQLTFPSPQTVGRIAMRGNREYQSGYDFVEGRFDILDVNGAVLWSEDRLLPDPDRDLDILVQPRITNATSVRFTSVQDQSDEPGFSELELFAN